MRFCPRCVLVGLLMPVTALSAVFSMFRGGGAAARLVAACAAATAAKAHCTVTRALCRTALQLRYCRYDGVHVQRTGGRGDGCATLW